MIPKVGLRFSVALVLFVVLTSSPACVKPVPVKVRDLLAGGQIDRALEAASGAPASDRPAVAEALYAWAEGQRVEGMGDRSRLIEVYLSAVSLDSCRVALYSGLAAVLQGAGEGGGHKEGAARGFALWQAAITANPNLEDDPEFRRAGSVLAWAAGQSLDAGDLSLDLEVRILAAMDSFAAGDREAAVLHAQCAAELAPERPDVLCLLAALGLLEPVPAEVVSEGPLPVRPDTESAFQARGGWVVLAGRNPDDPCAGCHGLSGTDLSRRWRIDNCRSESIGLSPSGRHVAFTKPCDDGDPCDVMIFNTATGLTHVAVSTLGQVWGISWSPDEEYLAVSSYEGLLLASRDGTVRRVLDQAELQGELPVRQVIQPWWFSGGDGIGGQDRHIDNVGQLWVFDPESGAKRKISFQIPGPYDNLPHGIGDGGEVFLPTGLARWSPDGRYLAVPLLWDDQPRGVVVSAAEPGKVNEGTVVVGGCHVWASPVAWSPDGRVLLLTMTLRSPTEPEALTRQPQLWLWDRLSSKLSLLVAGGQTYRAAWGDDGVLWYVESGERRLVGLRLGK